MIKVANNKYTLHNDGYVVIRCPNLANKVNQALNYYKDYRFNKRVKDEPAFKFNEQEKTAVYAALGVKK
jgi:hypothetical protein